MPNWCENFITISHDDPTMISRAKKGFDNNKFFNEFIPVPEPLSGTAATAGHTPTEQENLEKYGYSSWYDFCIEKWGTKWDVGGDNYANQDDPTSETTWSATFDTAWAPPIAFYEHLVSLGFTVSASYYEPGCDFAGNFEGNPDDGCMDDSITISDYTAAEFAEQFPDLDNTFNISEMLACREEEDEEEQDEDEE